MQEGEVSLCIPGSRGGLIVKNGFCTFWMEKLSLSIMVLKERFVLPELQTIADAPPPIAFYMFFGFWIILL